MSQLEFQVPLTFAYLAYFLWAFSGAIVGMHKGYDFTGVFVIALLSSTGGGLLRDGLFLHNIPQVLVLRWHIPLIVLACGLVALLRQRIARMVVERLVGVIDALGAPAFAVVGMQLSLQAGISFSGVVVVGVINGFGGGFLRDVVVGDTPKILLPGIYDVSALFVSCVLFLVITQALGVSVTLAAWLMIGFFFLFRMLSIRFNWQTRPLLSIVPVPDRQPANARMDASD
jgi:uncharacterized membrane protein YeiH